VKHSRGRQACTPLVAAAIALALAAPATTFAAGRKAQSHFDQFIVKFKDTAAEKSNAALRQRLLDGAGRGQGLHVGQLRRMSLGADVIRTDRKLDAAGAKAFRAIASRAP
jgi:serine protease